MHKANTKNKIIKFISAFLIVAILLPSVFFSAPKKADAVLGFGDIVFDIPTEVTTAKDLVITILHQVIITIEKRLLQQLTQNTVNWINRGFSGNPLYLQNPGSFFKDIAKFEVKNLVTLFGYDSLRYPFGKDFSLNLINSYKAKLEDNAQYSLSKVINDPFLLERYRNDFNVGGWNGFLINTQYPQNNYIGFQLLATEEAARKLTGTVQKNALEVHTTLQQGLGFLSPKTCQTNPLYNNTKNEFLQPTFDPTTVKWDPPFVSSPEEIGISITQEQYNQELAAFNDYQRQHDNDVDIARLAWGKTNACPPRSDGTSGLAITTPGSVVGNQISTAMSSTFRQSELGAALGNSIGAILDTLVNHFLDKGLNGLTNIINPPPLADTWNYYGNFLTTQGAGVDTPPEAGVPPPLDAETKHGNHQAEVAAAKQSLIASGLTFSKDSTACDRFAITKEAAIRIGGGAGLLDKPGGSMCDGFAQDIIAFPDGYIYDVINGTAPDGNGPGWTPSACGTIESNGTCPERYRTVSGAVNTPPSISAVDFDNPGSALNITVSADKVKNVLLSGGTQPYIITTQPDVAMAIGYISGNTLVIVGTGTTSGKTSIVIQDSSDKTITINITSTAAGSILDSPPTPPAGGAQTACTAVGKDEQNFMLPLLNAGTAVQDVIDQTNAKFHLTTGNQAVYYFDSNTIGLPEFYLAGPTSTRPVSPVTNLPWDVVTRCTDTVASGGICTTPPPDGDTRHGNHEAEVAAAKASIEAEGVVFSRSTPECSTDNNSRFEITKRAARLIGGTGNDAAGLLSKPGGNNCQGYSVDVIAFPDGYAYDVLNGTAPDGNGPGWSSITCLPADPSRYRPAI